MDVPKFNPDDNFKPSKYMRETHPDLFSDSVSISKPVLDKALLEYHLDTLTNRNQENLFEEFARRLIELEICPNIKPQSGPMGGGDGGYDASTHPVSKIIGSLFFISGFPFYPIIPGSAFTSIILPINWVWSPISILFKRLHSRIRGNSSTYGASTRLLFTAVIPVFSNLFIFLPDSIPQ